MSVKTPKEIVAELDRYIIGQNAAKKAVAVALRNRYRRSLLSEEMRQEVTPKNILMVGPTGVGKTEIARRLARLVDAPFVKVEATKFTEVGYVGRDVDSIVRDLVEASIRLVKSRMMAEVEALAKQSAEDRLAKLILRPVKKTSNPIDVLLGNKPKEPELPPEEREKYERDNEKILQKLREGELDDTMVEIEVDENVPSSELPGTDMKIQDVLGSFIPKKKKLRSVKAKEARRILEAEEAQNLIDMDAVYEEALRKAEQEGIVFIDELDKVAGKESGSSSPDVSREGVQRDILPIVEGSTVSTKYGPVKTDFMLFIAAGAFHVSKVSDLIPELQGRFPVRVDLLPLTQADFCQILTQPENALIKQYSALLMVDNVNIEFSESALETIAEIAFTINENNENIGARRLHTVLENLLEELAFQASGDYPPVTVSIDAQYVRDHLKDIIKEKDLKRFIL